MDKISRELNFVDFADLGVIREIQSTWKFGKTLSANYNNANNANNAYFNNHFA